MEIIYAVDESICMLHGHPMSQLIFMSVGGLNMCRGCKSIYMFVLWHLWGAKSTSKYPSCYEHSNALTPPNPDAPASQRIPLDLPLLETN